MKVLTFALMAAVSFAQTFEVASIRPHEGQIQRIGASINGMQVMASGSVYSLITYAYDLQSYEVTGISSPSPTNAKEFYDISARAPGDRPPSEVQVRKMVQALLAERFQLKFHYEMREMNVYGLVIAKGGSKIHQSGAASPSMSADNKSLIFTGAPISALARLLSNANGIDRPVIDKTGLVGNYDYQFAYKFGAEGISGPAGESIFTAVEEQLGLKLEKRKASVEVLVVDSVQKPSEN